MAGPNRETPPWLLRWLGEQQDGPYWRNGSLRPDYERIQCPVFIVAGWHDGYRTAGLRMALTCAAPGSCWPGRGHTSPPTAASLPLATPSCVS